MRNRTARIAGTGSYIPSQKIDNKELTLKINNFDLDRARASLVKQKIDVEKLDPVDVFDKWIQQVAGIRHRFYVSEEKEGVAPVEFMAREAALAALKSADVQAQDLDFVIASSFTPTFLIPNLAVSVAGAIGAVSAGGFTLNTACSGFLDGLIDAYYRIISGDYETILVVAAEALSNKIDFADPKTVILFGDGAAAAVLRKDDKGILSCFTQASYSMDHIVLKEGGFIQMGGGPHVQKKAVNAMAKAAREAIKKSPYELEDIDHIIPHQANHRITVALAKRLGVSLDKVCSTIDKYGNTSGASVAIALDKAVKGEVDNCLIKKGDKLLLVSVGGGYTYAGIVLEY